MFCEGLDLYRSVCVNQLCFYFTYKDSKWKKKYFDKYKVHNTRGDDED